jgi:integrase
MSGGGGTVKQAENGTWFWQFSWYEGGKKHTRKKRGFRTQRDARAALNVELAALGKGDRRVLQRRTNQTVSEYLAAWLVARKPGLKPTTHASYSTIVDAWITPHLGKIKCRDLTGDRIAAWHATLRESGGRGGRPLGSRSVAYASRVLSMSLAEAVEAGALAVNPMTEIPKRQRPTHKPGSVGTVWTGEQAAAFLAATAGDRLGALWALMLDSGCRRGEALALRWSDIAEDLVTFQRNRIMVGAMVAEGTPKGGRGRSVDLHPQTVAALRRWRTRQTAERLAAGPAWTDTGYVFTDEVGAPLRPDTTSARFERAVAGTGAPTIRLHDLRHTSATLLLLAGVPVHVVAARLGHSDPAITLRTYSHLLPTSGKDAAARLGAALYGG